MVRVRRGKFNSAGSARPGLSRIKVIGGGQPDPARPHPNHPDVSDQYNYLQQSYGRCLFRKGFIERFYEIFMASHPDVAAMFARTDFQKQRLALRRGISVAIFHASGSAVVKRTTEQMADVHSRCGRAQVAPELYPYWIDSLVQAVREFDDRADEALLARWREAMSTVVATFSSRH